MKKMKRILLVFNDVKELDFMEDNLQEAGFHVEKEFSLKDAVITAERTIPDLIVVNLPAGKTELVNFNIQVRTERLKDAMLLNLTDHLLPQSLNQHGATFRPVRPKLLLSMIRSIMNHEVINWLPEVYEEVQS